MKKRLLTSLVALMLICSALLTFTACDKHECKFDQQVVDQAYFASEATCTEKAKYYLSCTCGKFKDATFEHGEELGHEFTNYVPDNNATYDSDGTKTASCDRGCGATESVTDDGTKLQSHIEFKTLSLENKNVFANAVEEFSFAHEIEKFGYSEFEVARDKYGETVFSTGIVPLTEGDNVFYVLEKINGQYKEAIKVVLRRHPIYQVTINFGNGQPSQTQSIEESFTAQQPETNPVKDGYTFTGWNFDFNTAITENIEIEAIWTAHDYTPYSVEYYLQNLDDDGYALQENETENLTGTTDTTVYADIKTFDHFTPKQTQVSANLNGNGLTVLKVYYTRNNYSVKLSGTNCALSGTGNYPYGKSLTIIANVYLGYDFIGWYDGETLVSDKATYTFNLTKNITLTAKTEVKEEMKIFNFSSTENSCNITKLKDKSLTKVIIPECVTSIDRRAFHDYTSLTSIEIPNSVTSIGVEAFYGCTSLTSIEIPNSVTSIGVYAFSYCSSLTSIEIPNSVTSIGGYAFSFCSSLTSIEIPNSVTSIVSCAFRGCTSLTSIEIPNSVTSIGYGAFYNCSSLISIDIPGSVVSIDDYAFDGCSQLQNISFGDNSNLETIGSYTFSGCSSLISIDIPDSVISIGNNAFSDCTQLQTITFGDKSKLKTIGDCTFSSCSSLTNIVIPNDVTKINYRTFIHCENLTNISISNSVTHIAQCAFENCEKLKTITFEKESQLQRVDFGAFSGCDSLTYNIKDGLKYLPSENNEYFYLLGVEETSLTSITIEDGCKTIGYSAFSDCTSLLEIEIPASIKNIGYNAFGGRCRSTLKKVNFTGTIDDWVQINFVKTYDAPNPHLNSFSNPILITKNLYINNELLSNIVLTTATKISDMALNSCLSLESVEIQSNLTSIGEYAFNGCSNLKTITFKKDCSLEVINDRAFYNCSGITSIKIPESVINIGENAFYGCSNELIIYCEAESQPAGWDENWKPSDDTTKVVWGYKGN